MVTSLPDPSTAVLSEHPITRAFDAWMSTLPANTARAYRQSWAALLKHSKKGPESLERSDVAQWIETMKGEGKSPNTLNQRLAGISSFYRYLVDSYGITIDNPAAGKALRTKHYMWQGARYLDQDGCKLFLSMINTNTPQGSRDYALFLTYLMTGRRNTEIRNLRWRDIETNGSQTYYRWQGKGKARKDLLPDPVVSAITYYLMISHRLETIQPEDFIFTATRDTTSHLNGHPQNMNAPLSDRQVGRLLNKYLRQAGVQTHFRVHDLRHSAAMLRKSAGEDIEAICEFLDQSNVNTTRIYLHALEGHADKAWKRVGQMLGLDSTDQKKTHKPRIPHRSAAP